MYEVHQTPDFQRWLKRLPDPTTKARLVRRIDRLAAGNTGDHRSLGSGLFELREHYGPGYRIYFTYRTVSLVLLVVGGDKDSQPADIARARTLIGKLDAET